MDSTSTGVPYNRVRVPELITCAGVPHLVEVGQDRVHVVRHDDRGHALGAADPRQQRRHRGLVRQVETVEGFVEQEQLRAPRQCLGDEQPLLFPAGQLPDRPVRIPAGPDQLDQFPYPGGRGPGTPAR